MNDTKAFRKELEANPRVVTCERHHEENFWGGFAHEGDCVVCERDRLAAEVERLKGLYENPDGIDEIDKAIANWLECQKQRDALAKRVGELEEQNKAIIAEAQKGGYFF